MDGYVHTEELVFTSGGAVRRGWAEALARYQDRYGDAGGGSRMGTLAFTDIEVTGVGPDSAVVLGRWALQDTPQAGHGVFTLVFVRRGGRWQILHDHSSVAPADG